MAPAAIARKRPKARAAPVTIVRVLNGVRSFSKRGLWSVGGWGSGCGALMVHEAWVLFGGCCASVLGVLDRGLGMGCALAGPLSGWRALASAALGSGVPGWDCVLGSAAGCGRSRSGSARD